MNPMRRRTIWKELKDLTITSLNNEFQNVVDSFNSQAATGAGPFSGIILIAPDGKYFQVTVIYDSDGVTPLLNLQQVTL